MSTKKPPFLYKIPFFSSFSAFPYKEQGGVQKTKFTRENALDLICQKTFGLYGLKTYKAGKENLPMTAGSYICSPNETHITDPYERRRIYFGFEKKGEFF